MSGKILVLAALRDELSDSNALPGVEVAYTGVGKVNAALATAQAILKAKPVLVVNYGTAGKISEGLSGLLEIAKVVQRDMMTEPLSPRGTTPFSKDPVFLESGFGRIVCGTGDSFVTTVDPWLIENGIHLVDMELYAVALVCNRLGVPWRAFKFITDDANDFAAHEWTANVASGESLFWDALKAIVG
ncbi:5'-methylthioadenosine nucleosidase [Afipia sp. P52-10]|uniref:phosphorylase family protein n=1 Tax=Afipia sp. P52-10 TaxID=1429916 RepID=UPI0003DF15BE|nr:5'-methylthioadenosine nucleosidase [Afipia sp. P52-10]ETR78259.1 5'-methylthioadenosine nucleosidase [Afipia sp. P52-10]